MKRISGWIGCPFLAAAALLAFTAASRGALVIADFTSGANPVQNWGLVSLATGTPPVAGTGNWAIATVAQYWGQFSIPGWATAGQMTVASLNSYSQVELDMILPSAGWDSGNMTLVLEIEAENMPNTVTYSVNHNVSALKDQLLHFSMDYSSVVGVIPASGWVDMRLYVRPGYDYIWDGGNPSGVSYTAQTVYLDNITLSAVPEPSALLLAIGSVAVLGGRRRR